jgi:WD40 repeat protein
MEFPLLCDIDPRERNTYLKCVAFHPTANPPILAVGFWNKPVDFWRFSSDGSSRTLVGTLGPTLSSGSSIAFHPTADPPILAIDCIGCIELWRVSTSLETGLLSGMMVRRFDLLGNTVVNTVVFHPTNGFMARGGYDVPVRIWDLASPLIIMRPGEGICKETIPGLTAGTPVLTGLETSSWFNLQPKDISPMMSVWKRCKFEQNPKDLPIAPSVRVTSIAFHSTIPLLACCYEQNEIKLWRLSSSGSTAEEFLPLVCVTPATSVAFHPTAPILAAGCQGNRVELWSLSPRSGRRRVHILDDVGMHLNYIAFHPMAPVLALVSYDGTIKMWYVSPDGLTAHLTTLIHQTLGEPIHSAFHPTKFVMATCSTNSIKMWDCRQLSDMGQRTKALRVLGGLPTTLVTRLGTDPSKHHSADTRKTIMNKLAPPLSRRTASTVVQMTNPELLAMVKACLMEARLKTAASRKPAGGSSRRIKTKLKKTIKPKQKNNIKYKKYSKRRPIKNKN